MYFSRFKIWTLEFLVPICSYVWMLSGCALWIVVVVLGGDFLCMCGFLSVRKSEDFAQLTSLTGVNFPEDWWVW